MDYEEYNIMHLYIDVVVELVARAGSVVGVSSPSLPD